MNKLKVPIPMTPELDPLTMLVDAAQVSESLHRMGLGDV